MHELTPRQGERLPLEIGATVRFVRGEAQAATLEDISLEGCNLRIRAKFLQAGQNILVRIDGLESLIGQVRWVQGDRAGVQFERPLHIAVVEHIARNNPRIECAAIA